MRDLLPDFTRAPASVRELGRLHREPKAVPPVLTLLRQDAFSPNRFVDPSLWGSNKANGRVRGPVDLSADSFAGPAPAYRGGTGDGFEPARRPPVVISFDQLFKPPQTASDQTRFLEQLGVSIG